MRFSKRFSRRSKRRMFGLSVKRGHKRSFRKRLSRGGYRF